MLIRIPMYSGFNKRIELRCPDSAANPYLTLALCLAAGLDGIRNQIMPPKSVEENVTDISPEELDRRGIEALPVNLKEALEELKKDTLVQQVLGSHIMDKFIEAKEKEWEDYSMQVSAWEVEQYLAKI